MYPGTEARRPALAFANGRALCEPKQVAVGPSRVLESTERAESSYSCLRTLARGRMPQPIGELSETTAGFAARRSRGMTGLP